MIAQARPLKDFLACLLGPAVWAAHFFVVYGAETVVCLAASSPAAAMRGTVLAVTVAALLILALSVVRTMRFGRGGDASRFLRALSGWLTALSAAAIVATAASSWFLPACLSPAG